MAPIAIAAPAQAQVSGVAVANPEQAIQDTTAWKNAIAQIQTTYKAQIDQAQSRSDAVQAELKPLVQSFEQARQAANPDQNALQQQARTIQQKQQAAKEEISRLTQPVQRARAYALEQISKQYQAAVQAALQGKNVQILLRPDSVIYAAPTTDITSDITAQLNRLVTNVSTTPPANWQPGQNEAAGTAPATVQPTQPQSNPSPNGR
ncbi:OmpH family outer membrane protein [Stakelama saccharophila]|uniref:OmpH family outer membrane protein n=1 Tax=Stakelama saccharophila TaxID=3075605 RepID=A0ABZ0B561_9SPHN|nr:OmpH family outer membrane protein [Stakelama sp. W311]WNO52521.1 OmpH family outer membrane protein [Stakelama sp. W311]